jgi:polyphenol oxidase
MLLTSTLLSTAGFAHGFSSRDEHDSDVLARLGVDEVVQVKQVHGGRVVQADASLGQEADAIVARPLPGPGRVVGVGVRVADCVPVLLADPATGNVAAVHAGWRGVVAAVVTHATRAIRGAGPGGGGRLLAAIGPCIGPCCFEVGRDVADEIVRAANEPRALVRVAGDKAFVDLRAAVRAQLRAEGVADADVEDVPGCTKDDTHFHSFRRDGPRSGRMLAAIATKPGPHAT